MNNNEKLIKFIEDNHIDIGKVFTKEEIKSWLDKQGLSMPKSTLNCQLYQHSTNDPNRIYYKAKKKHDLFYRVDKGRYRIYNPDTDPDPIYETKNKESKEITESKDRNEDLEDREFAYERDLQSFLARNLDLIESGLTLYEDVDSSVSGLEVNAGGRSIDMLLLDKNNNFVVVELKVSRGYDRVVGQILRYIGWIRSNFAEEEQNVRGIIIARDISEDLVYATSEVDNISLMEYELDVRLKSIPKKAQQADGGIAD